MDIHTKGKLKLWPGTYVLTEDGLVICQVSCHDEKPVWEANARRIVACWNACDGVETELLEAATHAFQQVGRSARRPGMATMANLERRLELCRMGYAAVAAERDRREDNCDALLEALESALKTAEFENHPFRPWHDQARAAIKSVKGGK